MSDEAALTREKVVAGVVTDVRLREYKRDRCEIYYRFTRRDRAMTDAEYGLIEDGGCAAEFPLEEYPWRS